MNAFRQSLLETLGVADPWDSDYEHMKFDPQGWFVKQSEVSLDRLLIRIRPKVVIELGSWIGKSTRFLVDRCELVIAVDHWLGSDEHQEKYADVLPSLFDQFLSNCARHRDKIVPLRMASDEAAKLPLPEADLIYIDACHDEAQVKADIEHYFGFLSERGVLCGDDYQLSCARGQGIARAVHAFAQANALVVCVTEPFWWYESAGGHAPTEGIADD